MKFQFLDDALVFEILLEAKDSRQFLTQYFEARNRILGEPGYSSFAKKAGLSSRNLPRDIVKGSRNLTLSQVPLIARALRLQGRKLSYLEGMVKFERTSSKRILESLRGELYKAKVKLLSERENLKRFETLFEDEDIAKVYLFTNQSEGVSFSDLQNHLNLDPKLLRRQLNQLVQKEIIRFDSVKQKYFRDDRLVHTHLKNASPSDARFTQMVDTFSRFQREFTKYYASPVGVADPNRPYVFRLMSRVPRAEFQRLKDRFRTVIDEFLSEVNYLERNAPMEDSVFVEFLGGQMLSDKNE